MRPLRSDPRPHEGHHRTPALGSPTQSWKTVWVQYLIRVGTKDVKRRGGHNARRTPPPPSFPAAIHQPGNG